MILDLNHNYRKTVLLCGIGRSRSMWAAGILNYRNSYRYMFDPLHPDEVRDVGQVHKGRALPDLVAG